MEPVLPSKRADMRRYGNRLRSCYGWMEGWMDGFPGGLLRVAMRSASQSQLMWDLSVSLVVLSLSRQNLRGR